MKVKELIEELKKFDEEIDVDIEVFLDYTGQAYYQDIVSIGLNKTMGTLILKHS